MVPILSSIRHSSIAAVMDAKVVINPAIRNEVTTPMPAISGSEIGQVRRVLLSVLVRLRSTLTKP